MRRRGFCLAGVRGASGEGACSALSLPRVTIKMKEKRGVVAMKKGMAAKVVLLLKSFAGMTSEAQRESSITFGCGAERHDISVVVVRADQMMPL